MFEKIKVLVVDDSAFMRKFISDMINSQSDMKVIDTAKDGDLAIDKVNKLEPDVVTLDVEMPKKNGLEVLREIKKTSNAQVIMLSGLTADGSSITIESLESGAFDFVQKPTGTSFFKIDKIKEELIEKIRYASVHGKRLKSGKGNISGERQKYKKMVNKKIEAVALGASTGGPRVLYDVITKLPKELSVPIFVVQHMPAGFTKAFAERLNNNSALTVIEAKEGERIQRGTVYIAPGGYHMLIENERIVLDTSPPVHGVRPAVDKLFISAAKIYKDKLLCCVFTGMGKDGAEGVKACKALGGFVIAQDEATSTIYGMPKAAVNTGCVDLVLPDHKISEEIMRCLNTN